MNPLQNTAEIRQAALARLRYEQSMGLEILPRILATPTPAAIQTAAQNPAALPTLAPSTNVPAATVVKEESSALEPIQDLILTPEQRAQHWHDLVARAENCQRCVLAQSRHRVVFEDGNRQAQLVFVSEGPGVDEDMQGKPFVGQAGQLLNKIITALKLKREEVYLCNVIKCHPPQNRPPLPEEIAACQPFLHEQLALIRPKVIVALGGKAANVLLNNQQSIVALRGRWGSYRGIPVMPTYHPAFVLMKYTEENRRTVWEDLKKVLEKLQK